MKIKVVVHDAEEGGYYATVPALPGCVSEGDTREELLANIREAIECYLDAPAEPVPENAPVEEGAPRPAGQSARRLRFPCVRGVPPARPDRH